MRIEWDADGEQLAEFCGDRPARYKIPRHLWLMKAFPMTVRGKACKVALREVAARELMAGCVMSRISGFR
ncbi:hypothetical protein ACIBLA_13435 [Streptomyces sp. NPDC050433]|uniref:hypothetical protein n=1 Tax=Streptomyces sp. NPDC050433 TaxID=3365615 RepID=UPI0037A9F99E